MFLLSCPGSSSCLIDFSVDLCGCGANVGYFCGPGLIGGGVTWSNSELQLTYFLFCFHTPPCPSQFPPKARVILPLWEWYSLSLARSCMLTLSNQYLIAFQWHPVRGFCYVFSNLSRCQGLEQTLNNFVLGFFWSFSFLCSFFFLFFCFWNKVIKAMSLGYLLSGLELSGETRSSATVTLATFPVCFLIWKHILQHSAHCIALLWDWFVQPSFVLVSMFSYKESLTEKERQSDLTSLCCNGLGFWIPCTVLHGRRRFRGKARAREWGPLEMDLYQHCTQPRELRWGMGSGQGYSSACVGGEVTLSPLLPRQHCALRNLSWR